MTGPSSNPTPTRGAPIVLDRERHLRYSLRTIRELREEFGSDALEKGVGPDSIAKLIWYGLKHEDTELTIEQVEDMIDLEQLGEVMEAVSIATGRRALASFIPDPQTPASATTPSSTADAGSEIPKSELTSGT